MTIKPGVTAHKVDRAAREGSSKKLVMVSTSTTVSHGISMDVSMNSHIMEGKNMVIEKKVCFSVEPGIYIPGKVGVRVLDCGELLKRMADLFTSTSKDLLYFD